MSTRSARGSPSRFQAASAARSSWRRYSAVASTRHACASSRIVRHGAPRVRGRGRPSSRPARPARPAPATAPPAPGHDTAAASSARRAAALSPRSREPDPSSTARLTRPRGHRGRISDFRFSRRLRSQVRGLTVTCSRAENRDPDPGSSAAEQDQHPALAISAQRGVEPFGRPSTRDGRARGIVQDDLPAAADDTTTT